MQILFLLLLLIERRFKEGKMVCSSQPGRRIVLASLLAMFASGAHAGTIEVAPVVTEMAWGQNTSVVTITNRNLQSVGIQVRSFSWSQTGGRDRLDPTEELLVSPPVFELPSGSSQVVRLVLRPRGGSSPGLQRNFRLLVDEIPAPGADGNVRLALRLSLPVFAASNTTATPLLDWHLATGDRLVVANRGTRHARLLDVRLTTKEGLAIALTPPETPYVLPGAERVWSLRGPLPRSTTVHVSGTSEAGAFRIDVPIVAGR